MKSITILSLSMLLSASMQAQLRVTDLRLEHMTDPAVVDVPQPRFSWVNNAAKDSERGQQQTAYRIGVASSRDNLDHNRFDVWDSGRQQSSESSLVPYGGPALQSGRDYYWKVCTWDRKGKVSRWSQTAHWGMGLLAPSDWKAKWIASPQKQGAPLLRRQFQLHGKVRQAKAYITAGGYFEMYVNGQRIGQDQLVPNFTNYTRRPDLTTRNIAISDDATAFRVLYLAYDVTQCLSPGQNTVGAILGDGFYRCSSHWVSQFGQPCLLCQINITYDDGTTETVCSDASWQTRPSAITMNGVYDGEIYDARLETPGWAQNDCTASDWKPVQVVDGPCGKLTAHTSPTDRIIETLSPVSLERQADGTWLVDFGKEISGWIALHQIQGQRGDTLSVRYISESPLGQQTYCFRGNGPEDYAPRFTWYVFRQAIIAGIDQLKAEQLKAEAVNTDVPIDAEFQTSCTLLNGINDIWQRSQLDNMHGCVASDCPHRERSPYTGDGQIACATVMLNFDAAAFYQKWIRDMRDAQNPDDGYVPNGAPWQPGCGGGVAWGAAMNVMPWEYYIQYGDRRMLTDSYEAMKKQLGHMLLSQQEDGTMYQQKCNVGTTTPNYWFNLGDWAPAYKTPDDRIVHTFYLWLCARNTALAAQALGLTSEQAHYEALAEEVRQAFHHRFYQTDSKTYGDFGSNIFALHMGGMDDERLKDVRATLRHEIMETYSGHINTGFVATKFFFETLTDNGMHDVALSAITKTDFPSYGNWIERGATTTWEQWNGNDSRNHPMFGGGLTWLYRRLAGVEADPLQPGYRHVIIRPIPTEGVDSVHYAKQTPYGRLAITSQKQGKSTTLTLTVPVGSTATLILPTTAPITESRKPLNTAKGLERIVKTEAETTLTLQQGTYKLQY